MQEPEQVGDPGVGGDVGLPALTAVRQAGLDGHDGQLILIHRLKYNVSELKQDRKDLLKLP